MNLFPNRNFYPLQCGRDVALYVALKVEKKNTRGKNEFVSKQKFLSSSMWS